MTSDTLNKLIHAHADKLLNLILNKAPSGPRTYGFEYEFMPSSPLNLEFMGKLYSFLPECGFSRQDGSFINSSGVYITFEPGGQIEYHSTPLLPGDHDKLDRILLIIEQTNFNIKQKLGIDYITTGYIPNRKDSPLCLTEQRYLELHQRLSESGTLGHEMMKGTASIHFHVLIRFAEEIVPLFLNLCAMTKLDGFKMKAKRREIWDNTDPCRCGLLFKGIDKGSSPEQVIREIVRVTVSADLLDEKIPFFKNQDTGFDKFLYHLTTIFTDVRLNIKGPTFEIRTADSTDITEFKKLWAKFININEQI
jgi:glutamate--cysteine ligase